MEGELQYDPTMLRPRVPLLRRAAIWMSVGILATVLTGFIYAGLNWSLYLRVVKTAGLWYLNVGILSSIIAWCVRRVSIDRIPRPAFFAFQILAAVVFAALWTGMAFLDLKIYADPDIEAYLHRMPHQYFNIGLFVYGAVAGWLYTLEYHRRVREQVVREAELMRLSREAELRALKAQINPHFLFNTLNTVNSLARNDPEAARTVNARLASVFRYTLDGSESDTVTLGQELEFVRDYMEIEKARLRERLRFTMEADESLLETRIPPMILQPLVENAVQHGVARSPEGGTVQLTVTAMAGELTCRVQDDGPGVPNESVERILESGIGLRNVRDRLAQIYGKEFRFQIGGDSRHGCAVTISFPIRSLNR